MGKVEDKDFTPPSPLKKGTDHEMPYRGFYQFVQENIESWLIDLDLLAPLHRSRSGDGALIYINGKL